MKRIVLLVTLAALLVAALLPAGLVTAQEQTEVVRVEVGPTAKLIDDDQAVRVKLKVTCQPVDHVLEALLFVQQEGAFGQGFFPVVCDGRTRVHMAEVEALEVPFHRGEAFASAFVLVCLDENCSDTAQGQETRLVRVVG